MTPVFLLTDGYIANGSEPWRIPDVEVAPHNPGQASRKAKTNGEDVSPVRRDERLARPWAIPGTPGLMHRIGGLEKQDITGNVNYEPANHQHMVDLRAKKVASIALDIPEASRRRARPAASCWCVGWGGTYGALPRRCAKLQEQGRSVAHVHLRHLNPLPANLGEILRSYEKVLMPELNKGQLRLLDPGRRTWSMPSGSTRCRASRSAWSKSSKQDHTNSFARY